MPKKQKPRVPSARVYTFIGNPDYVNFDGSIDGDKLLDAIKRSPAAFDLMNLERLVDHGLLQAEYLDEITEMVSRLAEVTKQAGAGDERAADQLKAIAKLIQPDKYELPSTKIKEIVDRYETRPALARGWELRKLMHFLSIAVEPVRADRPYSPDQPIRVIHKAPANVHDFTIWQTAKKHWKPNTTLQSLAIRVYLEHLSDKGITDEDKTITERTLKRDLAEVRKWEETATDDEKRRRGYWSSKLLSGDYITWYDYSEGWKERKKARKAKGVTKPRTS
jgi:hypothetical protein